MKRKYIKLHELTSAIHVPPGNYVQGVPMEIWDIDEEVAREERILDTQEASEGVWGKNHG